MNILMIGGLAAVAAYVFAWPQICEAVKMGNCPATSVFDDLMAKFGGGAAGAPVAEEEAPPAEGEEGAEEAPPAEGEEGGEGESGGEEGGEEEYMEGEGGESYYVRAYPGYSRLAAY